MSEGIPRFNQDTEVPVYCFAIFFKGEHFCFLKDDAELEKFFKTLSPRFWKYDEWRFRKVTMKFGHLQKWDAEHKTGIQA